MDKKKATSRVIGLAIIIIAVLLIVFSTNIDEFKPIQNFVFGEEEEPTVQKNITDIRIYKFSDLHSNTSLNVEIWLINLGHDVAKDINIFIRARDQNGTVTLSANITPSVMVLRYNETASAIYTVPINEDDVFVLHTIEIEWNDGRIAYSKQTNL